MQYIEQFMAQPYADAILLVVGGLLSLIGFYKVVRKGFALVFWLILFAVGFFPVVYVFKGSDADFLAQARSSVEGIGSSVPAIKDDVLKIWCDKLDAAG